MCSLNHVTGVTMVVQTSTFHTLSTKLRVRFVQRAIFCLNMSMNSQQKVVARAL